MRGRPGREVLHIADTDGRRCRECGLMIAGLWPWPAYEPATVVVVAEDSPAGSWRACGRQTRKFCYELGRKRVA